MKYLFFFIIFLIVAATAGYFYYIQSPYFTGTKRTLLGKVESMTISSPAFKNNGEIPVKYTCDGENINPPLTFNGAPYGTKSLMVIIEDLSSQSKDFTHWVVFNIDPYSNGVEEHFISDNVTEGKNDFGQFGYGGPCPTSGTHRYVFKLYAVNTILLLSRGSTKTQILNEIKGHIIDEAETVGTYSKH